ncbi:cupin 2 conserved barrel domain protein [Fibrisoma limi BUZ 3]|uniref:Cupin 2 conserved barrel domain protein n=1 Tax=Fibrisoma limi BUZ 3 TaxID=1185876 RepID=I2GLV7_9BACT|nr:cupin domain-containing protein [Fibrisoma limi]CCH54883.1 cupin 2 conserved barrel domain protein [Fibrisoma limi BUZ 3]
MQSMTTTGGVVRQGEGKQFNVLGHAITALFTQHTTEGNYYVFELITPPGLSLPPHVHEREDELIYVLEGELEVMLGDQQFVAKAGDRIFFPRFVPHGFQNAGSKAVKAIFTVVPGGSFEEFFEKLAALPPGEPDMARIVEIFAEHGMTILMPQQS